MCWNLTDTSCLGQLGSDAWHPVRAVATSPITFTVTSYDGIKGLLTGQQTTCDWSRTDWVEVCYGADTILGASATTFGGVVNTGLSPSAFAAAYCGRLLAHETKHTDQWAIFGPGFAVLDLLDAAQGQLHASLSGSGHAGNYQLFENWAGLSDGGYTSCQCQ